MTVEECWFRWAANLDAMTAADRADFKEQWKLHKHPNSWPCGQCLNGEIILQHLNREQIRQNEERFKALQYWACSHLVPWQELQSEDYDFRSWAPKMTGKRRLVLEFGCVYEYARESRKLRGLCALMDPKRARRDWEVLHRGPGVPPATLPCQFEGLDEHGAEAAIGGWLFVLANLGSALAQNKSFAAVIREIGTERLLKDVASLKGNRSFFSYNIRIAFEAETFPVAEACEANAPWAIPDPKKPGKFIRAKPTLTFAETVFEEQNRAISPDGTEILPLKIAWLESTNAELGQTMEALAETWRPKGCPEPNRRRGGLVTALRAALDGLSAMRLASYYPKTGKGLRPGLQDALRARDAMDRFSEVRLGRLGPEGKRKPAEIVLQTNFDAHTATARKLFRQTFAFEHGAENAPTWTQRRRMRKTAAIRQKDIT